MTLLHSPSVQAPAAYSNANLAGGQLAARMAGTATAAQRLNLRTALQDNAWLFKIHPAETAAGLVEANLTFGYVPGNAKRYGAVGDDATLNGTALTRWLSVLGQATNEFEGFLPAGIYRCEVTIATPANAVIRGVANQTSVLKPTAAIGATAFLTTSGGARLHNFQIEGTLTSKATGLVIAPVGPDYNEVHDVWVQNFLGAANAAAGLGVGIIVQNVVGFFALRMFAVNCNMGMLVQSPTPQSLPTTAVFQSCRARTSVLVTGSLAANTGVGVMIGSGQQLTFRDCIFEVNQAQGVFAQASTVGGTGIISDLKIKDCWFEDNYHGHVDTGTDVYSLQLDGSTGGGVSADLSNLHFTQGAAPSDRKSILAASAVVSLEQIRCFFGFAREVKVTGGGAALVYVKDDAKDRLGRFISNAGNAQSVNYPPYLPIIDLGTGFSALPTIEKLAALAYSAAMTPDMANGNSFTVQVTNTAAFTINAPANAAGVQIGKRLSIRINNVSGNNVPGALTWNAVFKLAAWAQPQNNFYHFIEFEWDGTNWRECFRTTTQVPV